jgi:hypothetical protein
MCLWFVTMCPTCHIFSPIPTKGPIYCNTSGCYRKDLNPNELSEHDRFRFLNQDDVCHYYDCDLNHCGLIIRIIACGHPKAHRYYCHSWQEYNCTGSSNTNDSCVSSTVI